MASFRGHVMGASALSVAYLAIMTFIFAVEILPQDRDIFRGFAFPITIVALVVMFGIFPDIDINSHAQNVFFSIFFFGDVWLIWNGSFEQAAYLGLIAMLPVLSKHRGWTHSRYAMLLVPAPLLLLPALNYPDNVWVGMPYYFAAVTGYASHLFFDKVLFKKPKILMK